MPLLDLDEFEVPDARYPAAFLVRPEETLRLIRIEIEAFKGIRHLVIDLEPLTILTGPNNSGKSTILQAMLLGFECFRRCLDTSTWQLSKTGRAISEFDFLPVNQPKDLWYKQIWKPSREREQYVRVSFAFTNGFRFVARIRFLFGMLNVGLEEFEPDPPPELVKAIASSAPILIPATPGPRAHESVVALAQLHHLLGTGEPSQVVRNILLQLQSDEEHWAFVTDVIRRYFGLDLDQIDFDERRDLEIRAPYLEDDCSLDIVSAGAGLNQILQLAALIAWRRPGIVLLDEPDAHLHSTLQTKLLDFLYGLSSHYGLQIILATHSRDLISQAPLQMIIPVDLSRHHLAPLQSVEHLLLEFERQGTVSNIDLALLYQTKKCLFVEGPTDSRLLPKIADRLGYSMFHGRNQIVPFEFEGVDKLGDVPRVVALFERMIGTPPTWAVVRDRDANLPEVIEQYKEQAQELGIPHFHIWNSYSLENLLLSTNLLVAALHAKAPDVGLGTEEIQELLEEAIQVIEPEVRGPFVTKAQFAYKELGRANPYDAAAGDAANFLTGINTFEEKIQFYPGKRIFGQFVRLLQERYGIDLRLEEIVAVMNEDNSPEDIKRFLQMLNDL